MFIVRPGAVSINGGHPSQPSSLQSNISNPADSLQSNISNPADSSNRRPPGFQAGNTRPSFRPPSTTVDRFRPPFRPNPTANGEVIFSNLNSTNQAVRTLTLGPPMNGQNLEKTMPSQNPAPFYANGGTKSPFRPPKQQYVAENARNFTNGASFNRNTPSPANSLGQSDMPTKNQTPTGSNALTDKIQDSKHPREFQKQFQAFQKPAAPFTPSQSLNKYLSNGSLINGINRSIVPNGNIYRNMNPDRQYTPQKTSIGQSDQAFMQKSHPISNVVNGVSQQLNNLNVGNASMANQPKAFYPAFPSHNAQGPIAHAPMEQQHSVPAQYLNQHIPSQTILNQTSYQENQNGYNNHYPDQHIQQTNGTINQPLQTQPPLSNPLQPPQAGYTNGQYPLQNENSSQPSYPLLYQQHNTVNNSPASLYSDVTSSSYNSPLNSNNRNISQSRTNSSKIDPDQIPSTVDVRKDDQVKFATTPFLTSSRMPPFLSTTRAKAIDEGK